VPLTFRQLKSMQRMQELAPELQALKEKYKEDKQRQQQEMMKLYQERGINPLASCLPLLLQLPVFISLFYMLRTDLKKHICGAQMKAAYAHPGAFHVSHKAGETLSQFIEHNNCDKVAPHSAKFLFLPDITNKATGAALVVLILLYVGSQVVSTLVATATADPTQRRLLLVLPIIFVLILYRYPAGLLVYWITTNLWTIVQQLVIKRVMGPPPATSSAPASANGRAGGGLLKPVLERAAPKAEPAEAPAGPAAAPPRPPRKRKKRSGRRR
jgi:YidC/Oxa1 family membrane protein insertase